MNNAVRTLCVGSAFLALVAFTRLARAGAYTASFTGGAVTMDSPYGDTSGPMSQDTMGDCWGIVSDGTTNSVTGTITVTFTWVPAAGQTMDTDPPPTAVVVALSGDAEAYAYVFGGGTGTCYADDGLSDPEVDGYESTTSSGIHHLTQYGGGPLPVVTEYVTPNVVTAVTGSGMAMSEAYYYLSVNIWPQTLQFSGGIGPGTANGGQQYLIGQLMTAYIESALGIPDSQLSPQTPNWWSWNVIGGAPFASFNTSTTAIDVSLDAASNYQALTDPSEPSLGCYFAVPSNAVTVTCDYTINFPDGVLPLSLTGTVKTVAPAFNLKTIYGTAQALPIGAPPQLILAVGLAGAAQPPDPYPPITPGPGQNPPVIIWYGNVTTPAAFRIFGDGGQWAVTQTFTPSGSETDPSTGKVTNLAWTLPTPSVLVNGAPGLDTHFPYGASYNSNWFLALGSNESGADGPYQGLAQFNWTGGDNFHSYMIYVPPGDNSVAVPLMDFTWGWSATATFSVDAVTGTITWAITGNAQYGTQPASALNNFPIWTRRYSAATFGYQ